MKTRIALILVLALLGMIAPACIFNRAQPTGTPPVVQLMPDLPGYDVIEAQAVQDYIAGLAEGGALLAGHPELLLVIEKVDRAIACYQAVGAVSARIYSDDSFPLSSGAIAIADRNRLTDPTTFFRCVSRQIVPFSSQPALNPCVHNYTLQKADNEFYIIYVGTTQKVCHAFCVNLEGCSVH